MSNGLIWATAEDMARNRGRVLSLYRQILRSLNSRSLPMNLAARLAKKAQVRAIFMLGSEERSLHNIDDLIDTAEYSLSLLRKGEIPKYIQWVSYLPLDILWLGIDLCYAYTEQTHAVNQFELVTESFGPMFVMHESVVFLMHPPTIIIRQIILKTFTFKFILVRVY